MVDVIYVEEFTWTTEVSVFCHFVWGIGLTLGGKTDFPSGV